MVRNFLFHRVNPQRDKLWNPMSVELFDKCIGYISKKYTVMLFEELVFSDKYKKKALANKLHEFFPISAIVTEIKHTKRKYTFHLIIEKVIESFFLSFIGKAWWKILKNYDEKYPK